MKRACVVAAILAVFVAAGCRTTPETPEKRPVSLDTFEPASYLSTIHRENGKYPDLFDPASFALWVTPQVASIKEQSETEGGAAPDDQLRADALAVTDQYVVIECHLESVFSDMSIAYDVVRLRGVEVFMRTPGGGEIPPLQTVVAGPVDEASEGALKRFSRTTVLIFPKYDILAGEVAVPATLDAVQVVFKAHESEFYFEWRATPTPGADSSPVADTARAVELGFTDLFRRVRGIAHVFD